MAESYATDETVCAVARLEPLFVPAVVGAPTLEPTAKRPPRQGKRKAARDAGVIELEIDGVAMRVGPEPTPRRSRR